MKEIFFETRFGSLAALEFGQPEGDVILALHGWLDNAASFEKLTPFLMDYRVICLDSPGHGHSAWLPNEADYHIWTPVEAVADVIRNLSKPVHLLGHSMGGAVALLLAATLPNSISSVISIDIFGPLTQKPEEAVSNFRQAIQPVPEKPLRIFESIEQAVQLRATVGQLPKEIVRSIVIRNLKTVDGGWQWSTDSRLKARSRFRFTPDILEAFLKSIECPVLVIRAEDGYLSQDIMNERLILVPTATGITVNGHHHCHLDAQFVNPIADEILTFYASVS